MEEILLIGTSDVYIDAVLHLIARFDPIPEPLATVILQKKHLVKVSIANLYVSNHRHM